jgi:predicted Zn-dependent protease with MMP-like domain
MTREFAQAPSLEEIEAIAIDELSRIPEQLRRHTQGLGVRVEDFPPEDVLADLAIESPFELTGLYQGVPLTERYLNDVRHAPDLVSLYRRPLLDEWCETGEDLRHLVRHVLIHEIGHHFGFSDLDMERIEADMEN